MLRVSSWEPPQFPIVTFPPVKTAVITLAQLAALPTHAKHTLYTENPGGAVGSQHTELLFSPQTAPKSSANKLALHCEHK